MLCPTLTHPRNVIDFTQPHEPAAQKGRIEATEARYRLGIANLKKAVAAGIPFLTGTDTGFAVTPYGEWHAKELELFVADLGFSPAAALRAATEINARFMRVGDEIGVLEPGRAADFIVWDGSPLADIRLLQDRRRLRAVYLGGKRLDLADRPYDPRRSPTSRWRTGPTSTPRRASPSWASAAAGSRRSDRQGRRRLDRVVGYGQVTDRKAVPLGEDFGDPAAMASSANRPRSIAGSSRSSRRSRRPRAAPARPRPGSRSPTMCQNRSQSRRLPASRPSGGVPSAVRPTYSACRLPPAPPPAAASRSRAGARSAGRAHRSGSRRRPRSASRQHRQPRLLVADREQDWGLASVPVRPCGTRTPAGCRALRRSVRLPLSRPGSARPRRGRARCRGRAVPAA